MNHIASALQVLQAVIPSEYWTIPDGHIGPLPIHPFGLLVATGIIVGHKIATNRAKVLGIDEEQFEKLVFWTVATGVVLSHMLDAIFYHWDTVRDDPLYVLRIWEGLSSFGGFFGAAIGFFVYSRRHQVDVWRSADAIGYGLPVGWMFGRTGCSVVHDHPGAPSNLWFAMHFPARPQLHLPEGNYFDLGFTELIFVCPLMIILAFFIGSRTTKRGVLIGSLAVAYPILRFPLDYLRMPDPNGGDVRYLGLTPGQYASIICVSLGVWILFHTRNLPPENLGKKQTPMKKKPAAQASPAA